MTTEEIQDTWDTAWKKKQSSLLDDDISAATKQISVLRDRTEKLSQEIQDLEFYIDELTTEKGTLDSAEPATFEDTDSTFFSILSAFEDQESKLKSEFEAYRQISQNAAHDKNALNQQLSSLRHKYEIEKGAVYENQKRIADLENELIKEKEILDKKHEILRSTEETAEYLEEEMRSRSEDLLGHTQSKMEELRQNVRQLKSSVADAEKKRISLQQSYANKIRKHQEEINQKRQELELARSIKSWQHNRSILQGKLKRLQSQLTMQQRVNASAQKREADLRQKFRDLLNCNDEDGTSLHTRRIVHSALQSMTAKQEQNSDDEEIEMEKELGEELDKEISLVENSIEKFERYSEQQIVALQEELSRCSQQGYIQLLEEEMDEMQSSL